MQLIKAPHGTRPGQSSSSIRGLSAPLGARRSGCGASGGAASVSIDDSSQSLHASRRGLARAWAHAWQRSLST
eukprot:76870-Pleurochrysis_carterae.AAC.1